MMWKTCRRLCLAAICVVSLLPGGRSLAAVGGPGALPKFDDVKKAVLARFGTIAGHQPGDIISQSQVAPLFRQLDRIGWRVAASGAILDDVLPDGDLLVRQLRSPAGKKFARRLAGVPDGYDRLDRLTRMPRGRQNLETLIREPDGQLMIEYMTTTREGKNLGAMLAETPRGRGFNASTGRIYTVDQLLDRLESEYKLAARRAAPQATYERKENARNNR